MYVLDPRPYPRLTAAQIDHMLRQVALYLALMDWCRAGHDVRDFDYVRHDIQTRAMTKAKQLELF
jgi:hypothetical protein